MHQGQLYRSCAKVHESSNLRMISFDFTGVDPKDPSAETRWCCLMAYRAPDPYKRAPTESRNLPPMWEREQVAQLDGELATMVRAAAPLFDQY